MFDDWRSTVWVRARELTLTTAGLAALAGCGVETGEPNDPPPTEPQPESAPGGTPRGQWYRVERPDVLDEDQAARARALEGLGYASGMTAAGERFGVLVHDEERTEPGFNLYTSGHGPEALLIDARGQVLHRWEAGPQRIWPGREDLDFGYFRKAKLLPGGALVAIFEGKGLVVLEEDSTVRWAFDGPAHHDAGRLTDGGLYALVREARLFPQLHPDRPLADDLLVFFDEAGSVVRRTSLLEALLRSPFEKEVRARIAAHIQEGLEAEARVREQHAERLAANPELLTKVDYIGDVLHTNSVRRLTEAESATVQELEEGWFLLSIRQLDAIAALELGARPEDDRVPFFLTGSWDAQHEVSVTEDGRLLLFDNLGPKRLGDPRASRVLEIDPASGEVLASFPTARGSGFYSTVGGACHRLPGGNTLIVESTAGRAIEVDPSGETVWEFVSPHRAGEDESMVAFLPDVVRLAPDAVLPWLGD